jgi:hypothetical protein
MTGWAKSPDFAGEHEESFRATLWTPNPCKTTLRIATVQIFVHNLLNNRTKIAVLSLKPVLILQEKSIEAMKKHSIENTTFRMTLVINPCHGSRDDSENMPNS